MNLRGRCGAASNKDDRFDAFVLADALRTDRARLRPLTPSTPATVVCVQLSAPAATWFPPGSAGRPSALLIVKSRADSERNYPRGFIPWGDGDGDGYWMVDVKMPTFVFVHGAHNNSFLWTPLIRELAFRGHRSLALDLPGHGLDAALPLSYQAPGGERRAGGPDRGATTPPASGFSTSSRPPSSDAPWDKQPAKTPRIHQEVRRLQSEMRGAPTGLMMATGDLEELTGTTAVGTSSDRARHRSWWNWRLLLFCTRDNTAMVVSLLQQGRVESAVEDKTAARAERRTVTGEEQRGLGDFGGRAEPSLFLRD